MSERKPMHAPILADSEPSWHLTRRGRVVAGLAALGLSTVAVAAAYGPVERRISGSVHQVSESKLYSQRNLYERMESEGTLDLTKDKVLMIKDGDTPSSLAAGICAADVRLVADEIANQAGGQHNLQPGDFVVLPLDQLAPCF